jgi:hypothetical protein
MGKMVSEDIHDFLDPGEIDPDLLTMDMGNDNFLEDENGEEYIEMENTTDQMKKVFRTEIAIPEYSRSTYLLELKDKKSFEGTPMAELSSTNAFLFKIDGQLKKIKLADIVKFKILDGEESEEIIESFSKAKFISESIESKNYAEEFLIDYPEDFTEEDLVSWVFGHWQYFWESRCDINDERFFPEEIEDLVIDLNLDFHKFLDAYEFYKEHEDFEECYKGGEDEEE